MADQRGRVSVKLVDPTTNANEAAVSSVGALRVDVAATAAALADATANPTTSLVAGLNEVFNGTTWDRQRSISAALDTTGTGYAGAGIMGQLDDAATQTVTENNFAAIRISTRRALLVEGVASGTNINVALAASSATVTVDTELNTAAALADAASASVSTATVGAVPLLMNATTIDRARAVVNSLDSTGTGIQAAGMVGQLDDSGTSTVTENQFAVARISSRRAQLVEGVASGTNINVNLAASAATVTVDTEMPTAAALGDALSATTSTTTIASVQMVNNAGTLVRALSSSGDSLTTNLMAAPQLHGFDGTTSDRLRTTDASDGNGALTSVGLLGVGIGPGFSRRFNPSNLGTANNSASTVDTNGAGTIGVQVGTTTSGTYVIEATNDGTTWVAVPAINSVTGGSVQGTSLTPTTGDMFVIGVNGYRQFRLRTNATLGATMAHVITLHAGSEMHKVSAGGSVDTELPAAAALSDTTGNPTAPMVGSGTMLWDGSTNWVRGKTAATLADALANPGAGLNQGQVFLMGYNSATWDRVRVANTGRLQVDVVTGGGSDTPTNPATSYVTSASLAAGGNVNLDTADIGAKKLSAVEVWSSVPFKAGVYLISNSTPDTNPRVIGGAPAYGSFNFKTPHRNYFTLTSTAGTDAFRVNVVNLDNNTAADVYATFQYED